MKSTKELLAHAFGDYRAETWAPTKFGALFIPPPYTARLEGPRPCMLVGGRGTGKTTALQSLRYDVASQRLGLHRNTEAETTDAPSLAYLGVYLKANKNQTSAFEHLPFSKIETDRLFAHYINLLLAHEIVRMLSWLSKEQSWPAPSETQILEITESLGTPHATTAHGLASSIRQAIRQLETHINNPDTTARPILSIAEAPLRIMADTIVSLDPLGPRPLFVCIDEYENLGARQQELVNTYIKHSDVGICFKIGVRRFGLRSRRTSNELDLLATPDDYLEIDVADADFEAFATSVAALRLSRAIAAGAKAPGTLGQFLPGLGRREEAERLGAAAIATSVADELRSLDRADLADWARSLGSDAYFIKYWSLTDTRALPELASSWKLDTEDWAGRLNNYGYASLFWISKGHKGLRIRKYYCGVDTFLSLACGNIRYFLELIDESINQLDESQAELDEGLPFRLQTEAAKAVAKRRLDQLEGSGERSIELKRLVLALGKVFFELARDPVGHSPEASSFVLSGVDAAKESVTSLLMEGVAHLAFDVSPRTKATSVVEMKDEEYRLHPIFCAYFEFSYRRKRRVTFAADDLLLVMQDARGAIRKLLDGRALTPSDEVPPQLEIFAQFYEGVKK